MRRGSFTGVCGEMGPGQDPTAGSKRSRGSVETPGFKRLGFRVGLGAV